MARQSSPASAGSLVAGLVVALTESNIPEQLTSPRHQRGAERQFALLRNRLVRAGREKPVERVAAFFVILARNNTYEGRDPYIIVDSLRCGFVAGYLQMSIDVLASALVDLERRGLIEPGPQGTVRLKNVVALERLADGTQ